MNEYWHATGLFAPNLRPVCRISSSGRRGPDRFSWTNVPDRSAPAAAAQY